MVREFSFRGGLRADECDTFDCPLPAGQTPFGFAVVAEYQSPLHLLHHRQFRCAINPMRISPFNRTDGTGTGVP